MLHPDNELILTCLEDLFRHRAAFARRFYDTLFELEPEAERYFSGDRCRQEQMLFAMMTMILTGLCSGRDLSDDLVTLGRLHARVGIGASFFPIFGTVFVDTMLGFLPDRRPEPIRWAWQRVWDEISAGMIAGIEAERAERARRVFFPMPRPVAVSPRLR